MNYTLAPLPTSTTPHAFRDDDRTQDVPESPSITPAQSRRIQYTPPPPPSTAPAFLTANAFTSSTEFLYSAPVNSARSSMCSTAATTPAHSRSASPSPLFYSFVSSNYSSDTDSDPSSPSLSTAPGRPWWRDDTPRRRWWAMGNSFSPRRRRRGRYGYGLKSVRRLMRNIFRRPFIPKQPLMIFLSLLLLTTFGICLTLLIMHILNPDKEPLPWRLYCSIPSNSTSPPPLGTSSSTLLPDYLPTNQSQLPPPFPPPDLDSLPSVGVFIGVFSLDSAMERRMLIRSTWASHKKSREGGGMGDGGIGTSRTIVRFILGQPSREWERRVRLEMEAHHDIVILPMYENMNAGKSHAYFTWAASNAWVPPHYQSAKPATFSYSNATSPVPPLSRHDPILAWEDSLFGDAKPWVRPDFVVKADDDSFVMLAELESRLRVQLYDEIRPHENSTGRDISPSSSATTNTTDAVSRVMTMSGRFDEHIIDMQPSPTISKVQDPLIYWGYLVKNRFMAGELYALSWALVDWVASDSSVKTMTKGAEDKQTAKWVMSHPQAQQVRWASEKCWIYDHPRAGTVYSHGYLFPSEVSRVKEFLFASLEASPNKLLERASPSSQRVLELGNVVTPSAWAHSSVSTFGVRYALPLQEMSTWQTVEALVEGSEMSKLREDSPMTADYAWDHREGRIARYHGKHVGGTVIVHFIKKNMWFMETALALLEMEDVTELEKHRQDSSDGNLAPNGRLAGSSEKLQVPPSPREADLSSTYYNIADQRLGRR